MAQRQGLIARDSRPGEVRGAGHAYETQERPHSATKHAYDH
jgi:hypothetical protein